MVHMCVTHNKRAAALRFSSPFNYYLGALENFAGEIARTPGVAAKRMLVKRERVHAVGYIGWVGHRNLGDEVLFQAIQRGLRDFQLLPILPEPGERMLTRWGLGGRPLFRAVLLGGGTLVNCSYLPVAQLVRALGLPIYSVGTGVGSAGFGMPFDGDRLGKWKAVFDDCDFLSVRGPLSALALQRSGLTGGEVIGDPALGLAPETLPRFRTRRRLAINLAQDRTDYPVFEDVAKVAAEFLQGGGEVVGIAIGGGDRAVLERFRSVHRLSEMTIEEHRDSGEDFLASVAGSTALIGVRLHSAVLACCVGVPPIMLAYRSKCRDFMQSMHLDEFCIPLEEERSGSLLRVQWRKILSEPGLGEQIYRQSIFWKRKQQAYYARLTDRLNEYPFTSGNWNGTPSGHSSKI